MLQLCDFSCSFTHQTRVWRHQVCSLDTCSMAMARFLAAGILTPPSCRRKAPASLLRACIQDVKLV